MKSGRQIVILAAFIFLNFFITAGGQSFPLLSLSNTCPTNALAAEAGASPKNAVPLIPLIEFEGVPITVALENLARQAGLNYLLDPQIGYNQPDQDGQIRPEPVVSLRWENVTAEHAFITLCRNYGLTIANDTNSHVVLIRAKHHSVNIVTPDFYDKDTNVIPVIEFQDLSLSIALKNLAKQTGLKYIFSPKIDPWQLGNEPQITIRWENMTAKQALAALCENYDLDIIKYPISGIIRIEPAD